MLDLRRLRLLRELHQRGTIAAVADALQFTPSAVSQQLAMLEREAGVKLLEKAGRGVRLTDAALVLVGHADALLDRAAPGRGRPRRRGRHRLRPRADRRLPVGLAADRHPGDGGAARATRRSLRCELIEAEPEDALPALALGDLDLVLGDEWEHQPRHLPARRRAPRGPARRDPPRPPAPPPPRAARSRTPSRCASSKDEAWVSGPRGMGWEELTQRACREHGGFEPDIRHRTNDATISLALVAHGLAVALLPDLALPPDHAGTTQRAIDGTRLSRGTFAVTRTADAARPVDPGGARRHPRGGGARAG